MRSPIIWFGGKGRMVKKILSYLQRWPHRIYVEPFGGGASMLFAKRLAQVEVYNDLDFGLYHFFTVLSDPRKFTRFYRRVQPLLYSRQLYNECRKKWRDEPDEIWRAVQWFVVARMSFGGHFGHSWGSAVTASQRGMAETASKWLSTIEHLPQIHARIKRVQIENADWRVIFERYDTPKTLFYLDPPYVAETRSTSSYAHEMTDIEHGELVETLLNLQGAACLSGYPHSIYDPLTDAGWRCEQWETACYAAGRTRDTGIQGKGSAMKMQPRTECLWVHPRIAEKGKVTLGVW